MFFGTKNNQQKSKKGIGCLNEADSWIAMKNLKNEIFGYVVDVVPKRGGEFDGAVEDNFKEIILVARFSTKRRKTAQQNVYDYTDRPDVHFFRVFSLIV